MKGFFAFLGFVRPSPGYWKSSGLMLMGCGILFFVLFNIPIMHQLATAPNTMVGGLIGKKLGFFPTLGVLMNAWLQTALPEEMFFRGFLSKRLIAWLGTFWGQLLQASVFGLIHLSVFLGVGTKLFTIPLAIMIFGLTGLMGWLLGTLNESLGNGSIVPGWVVHGTLNSVGFMALILC